MQVLPQAFPIVQILQQDWAGGVERRGPLTPGEYNNLFWVWGVANTVSREFGAVWEPAEVTCDRKATKARRVRSISSLREVLVGMIHPCCADDVFIELCLSGGEGGHTLADTRRVLRGVKQIGRRRIAMQHGFIGEARFA
jgi:hypothetical protein